jgi:hypothetical protein
MIKNLIMLLRFLSCELNAFTVEPVSSCVVFIVCHVSSLSYPIISYSLQPVKLAAHYWLAGFCKLEGLSPRLKA